MPPLLNTVECPRCNTSTLFLWSNGHDALCERCYRQQTKEVTDSLPYRVILTPTRTPDGTWDLSDRIRFPELRQYIDDCFRNEQTRYDERLLTADAKAIESLIRILETLVTPNSLSETSQNDAADRAREQIIEIQKRSVRRLWNDFERWKRGELIHIDPREARRVQWRILAPDGHSRADIVRYSERRGAQRPHRFVAERLNMIYDRARPDELYEGVDSFEGYLVFVYQRVNKAIMESGEVGNAIFVVNADRWRFLSQLSKLELLTWYSDEIRRFDHLGVWQNATRDALRYVGLMRNDEL